MAPKEAKGKNVASTSKGASKGKRARESPAKEYDPTIFASLEASKRLKESIKSKVSFVKEEWSFLQVKKWI